MFVFIIIVAMPVVAQDAHGRGGDVHGRGGDARGGDARGRGGDARGGDDGVRGCARGAERAQVARPLARIPGMMKQWPRPILHRSKEQPATMIEASSHQEECLLPDI